MGRSDSQRTVLILGAGTMQLPPIRAARRLGLRVVVADGNRDAVARAQADHFLHVDLKDREGMLEAARELVGAGGLHAVFTAGTDFSATVAYVTEHLGLPGTSYDAALDATDKFRMRRVLKDAGVSVPDFALLTAGQIESGTIPAEVRALSLPVVVKPADSMGARGVVRADEWGDVLELARLAVAFSRTGRVVVEGYIDGPEFSIDAIVYGDTVQITGFADRHIAFPPYFIEIGHTIPTDLRASDQDAIVAEFTRAVRALGIGPGAAKGDMKLSATGPVVGEIAARLSGGYMSGWTFPLSSGVNLSEAGLRVALGEPPGSLAPRWNRTSAERAIVSIPGTIERIDGIEAARSTPGVEELFVLRGAGDSVRFPQSNVEKAGNVIAVGEGRDAAQRSAERAVAAIEVVLRCNNRDTDEFLFDSLPPGSHWAYDPPAELERSSLLDAWTDLLAASARPTDAAKPMLVKLPDVAGSADSTPRRDWSGRTLDGTIDILARDGVVEVASPAAALASAEYAVAGQCFIRALYRGGLQGARYAVRTLATRSAHKTGTGSPAPL